MKHFKSNVLLCLHGSASIVAIINFIYLLLSRGDFFIINLIISGVVAMLICVFGYIRWKDVQTLQTTHGKVLNSINYNVPILCLIVANLSLFLTVLTFIRGTMLHAELLVGNMALPLITTNYEMLIPTSQVLIIEEDRCYFNHHWFAFDDIVSIRVEAYRKDTKKVVLFNGKRNYDCIMNPSLIQTFLNNTPVDKIKS